MKRKKRNKKIRRIIVYIVLTCIFVFLGRILYKEIISQGENSLVINETQKNEEQVITDINIGIIGLDTLNPILTNNEDVINFTPLVYNSLFSYDNTQKLNSDLVEEYNYNDNKLVIRLKKDILWQNGDDLTTEDILFTFNMINEHNSIYKSLLKDFETIEIVDKYNLNFILKDGLNRVAHTKLTFPIISKTYFENEDFLTTYKNMIPMGTGKFKYSQMINDKEYVFTQNAYYKGEKITITKITVKLFDTLGQAISSIKSKKVDIINTKINNYEEYLGTIGYQKNEYVNNNYICLGINKDNTYLSNVNIRKAINTGIDKQNIFDNVFNGNGYISQSIVYPNSYLYNNINEKYDINIAKQYLASSNVNEKITLRLLVNNNENNILIANRIKEDIEKVGISINIEQVDRTKYMDRLSNKDYDLAIVNFQISESIDLDMYSLDKYYNIFNLPGYQNIDKLTNNKYYTEDELKLVYQELQTYIKENIPYIGIGFNTSTIIYNNNLIGISNPVYNNIFNDINKIYKKK